MASTTNYGWVTPDDTSLVKDGAAAIRTLGSSVDTTTKALNPSTTLGDIEYRSATANTNTRLGIGTTGQILTVTGGVPAWATPGSSFGSYTLLSSTALTGATTITINVATKENYMILIGSASAGASSQFQLRMNGDSGSNYNFFGGYYSGSTPSAVGAVNQTQVIWARMGSDAAESCRGGIFISGGSTTGGKTIQSVNFSEGAAGTLFSAYSVYNASAAVTSISLISTIGNFDAGTAYVWGS
jgi:hypothetical protein